MHLTTDYPFNTSVQPTAGIDTGELQLLHLSIPEHSLANSSISSQTVVLTVLLCVALAAAAVAALATARRPTMKAGDAEAAAAADEVSQSAPATRCQSYARLGAKFSSSEQLDRVHLVAAADADAAGADAATVDATVAAASIDGPAELRFRTKLDLLEGILYLHSIRLSFRLREPAARLDDWRAVIDIRDAAASSEAGGCQQWRIEARLTACGSRGGRWRTEAIDYVASLRLQSSRLMPHERQLLVVAFAVRPTSAATAVLGLGRLRFPAHLANEPSMEFCVPMVEEGLLAETPPWRHHQPAARLHLGLMYNPGAVTSSIGVRLVEVFDVAGDLGEAANAATATATVSMLTRATTASTPVATFTARRAGPGAFVFDRPAAAVLAIDNLQLQSACVRVDISVGGRPAGRVQLGDFARANGPAMRQWNAAVNHPSRWLWLTHSCL